MQEKQADMRWFPRSGRSPGGGHGNPLLYSCLENPMDRGAWWATIQRVAKSQTKKKKSQTWLKWVTMHRTSLSLAAKNITNLILVLTIWWCPCVESSLVLLEEGISSWPVCSLGKIMLALVLLHSVFQGQTCWLLQVSLDFLLLHSIPKKKRIFFWC